MATKTTREQIAELQGILPYADADPSVQAQVDAILNGQLYEDVSRAKRDQIDALLGPRPLADLDPTARWLIKAIRDLRRTNRILTAFAEACVEDGSISARAIALMQGATEANALDPADKANLFGED